MTGPPVGFDLEQFERIAFTGPVVQTIPGIAAGADWTATPSQALVVRLLSINATLVASSHVATRIINLQCHTANGELLWDVPSPSTIAASGTGLITWARGLVQQQTEGNTINNPLPDLWLPPGCNVKTVTTAIDVADQWSAITLLYDVKPYTPLG